MTCQGHHIKRLSQRPRLRGGGDSVSVRGVCEFGVLRSDKSGRFYESHVFKLCIWQSVWSSIESFPPGRFPGISPIFYLWIPTKPNVGKKCRRDYVHAGSMDISWYLCHKLPPIVEALQLSQYSACESWFSELSPLDSLCSSTERVVSSERRVACRLRKALIWMRCNERYDVWYVIYDKWYMI